LAAAATAGFVQIKERGKEKKKRRETNRKKRARGQKENCTSIFPFDSVSFLSNFRLRTFFLSSIVPSFSSEGREEVMGGKFKGRRGGRQEGLTKWQEGLKI
jgi:hypothetical protein